MITLSSFHDLGQSLLGKRLDPAQREAVSAPLCEPLFLVAGPGSGKTTVLALRVLKFIFVDDVDPSAILATTFTRKAASELRSRILGWGDKLRHEIVRSEPTLAAQMERLDLNRLVTGTLDSIAEEALRDHRAPGTQPAIVVEEFVADALMIRRGFFEGGRYQDSDLYDVHYILTHQLADAQSVAFHLSEKIAHKGLDPAALESVLVRKRDTLDRLWEPRLRGQMRDLPMLDAVVRETNRWLRQSGLV